MQIRNRKNKKSVTISNDIVKDCSTSCINQTNPVAISKACAKNVNQTTAFCSLDFDNYIGQMVTIYVGAGGSAGDGFTGVLLKFNTCYITLLAKPTLPPVCALGSTCTQKITNPLMCSFCPHSDCSLLGAIVDIPQNSIVAFVHNALSSNLTI